MSTFEQFAAARKQLQEFCQAHYASLHYFRNGISFFIDKAEKIDKRFGDKETRHLTSTATCYASLSGCRANLPEKIDEEIVSSARTFSMGALQRAPANWTSDGSAPIYCRSRTLPFVISNIGTWDDRIAARVDEIFKQLRTEAERFGIGEQESIQSSSRKRKPFWYPPNAYHIYWGIATIETFKQVFPKQFTEGKLRRNLPLWRERLMESARRILGYQIALHSSTPRSSMLDSDQLAWALATLLRNPKLYQADLAQQDLIRQAFKCLFETQTEVGTWRHYAPLFHYKESGNAYCYIFETLTALLGCAMLPAAEFVRSSLQSHFERLMLLLNYAKETQTPLDDQTRPEDGAVRALGWCSGHRVKSREPESWATASVFSYAQTLRRLVGIWARDAALNVLPRRTTFGSKTAAAKFLRERADTWNEGGALLEQLYSMFINQVGLQRFDRPGDPLDPDTLPVGEHFPRSAIFYGPPGASKTSIVRALAGTIGWDYVELHASHFVADGLPAVQKKADEIFQQLMQLDHAVILFDEIDELVREREDRAADAFGRFLTTSMLPKLAELWNRRKVMYFVATNHIEYFDRAITRSERFDAIVFVTPPSFEVKKKRLTELMADHYGLAIDLAISQAEVDDAMPDVKAIEALSPRDERERKLSEAWAKPLAKLALLRYDELPELAYRLKEVAPSGGSINSEVLAIALAAVRDGRSRVTREYFEFRRDSEYCRRDYSKNTVWRLHGLENNDAAGMLQARQIESCQTLDGNRVYFKVAVRPDPKGIVVNGYETVKHEGAIVYLRKAAPKAT